VKKLTTTSHAILSLLAVRPWSAYELTQQMHRSVGVYWPRAERGIYDEVKNLVAHGLAEVEEGFHGRRPRSIYRITPAGRDALREWLATPVNVGLEVESETVLRVAFAENGSREDVLHSLAALRTQIADHAELGATVGEQYLSGQGPYPQRVHVISLVMRFLIDHLEAVDAWARWATAEVETWDDVAAPPDPDRALAIVGEIAVRARRLSSAMDATLSATR
jgi:DNA-binding PadR family transcriptional regulator